MEPEEISLTVIEDIKTGHAQNISAATGCTVIICEKGATVGVDVRGALREPVRPTCSGPKTWWNRSMHCY